ncbi:MAG TPA: ATP-grasp domain-containing protein [Candidatus Methylacidiphilales bacterium]|nr:ATP-grasp domain-containing protein [Candidatus Methylacidiphilales bacterium]
MNTLEEKLSTALVNGILVPIIGAGVSMSTGGPSWAGLLHQLALPLNNYNEIKEEIDSGNSALMELAGKIMRIRRNENIPPHRVTLAGPSPLHVQLASWQCNLYLTTNFDDGLERAFIQKNRNPLVIHNDQCEQIDLTQVTGRPIIVKLCSTSQFASGGALTSIELAKIVYANTAIQKLLSIVFHSRVALFIGCGMKDPLLESALYAAASSGLYVPRHVALLSNSIPQSRVADLRDLNVDSKLFSSNRIESEIVTYIKSVKPSEREGSHSLLIFEPGTVSKAHQIIDALSALDPISLARVVKLGIITEHDEILDVFNSAKNRFHPPLIVECFKVADVSNTDKIIGLVAKTSAGWNSILAIYEFTIEEACDFADNYKANGHGDLAFHCKKAVKLSRDKRLFRQLLSTIASNTRYLSATPYAELELNRDWSCELLLEKIKNLCVWKGEDIVVKPVNAAGSIGVRPLSLNASKQAQSLVALQDLKNVFESLSKESSTKRCNKDILLVEQRLIGEEFSVEARSNSGVIEVLAIHWKPEIDSDPLRFFERIYVTLPSRLPPHDLLTEATDELLQNFEISSGVFHAEFRINESIGKAFPIEVGLRPGGGTVSAQVRASCGVDMFESSVRSSLRVPQLTKRGQRIIASAEVFADTPGVLPPLRVQDEHGGSWSVRKGDEALLQSWLNSLIARCNRSEGQKLLYKLLNRESQLCSSIKACFDSKGNGIKATLESVDIWMQPGEAVTEEEACYVAGLRIAAHETLDPVAAVAESLAAMEICFQAIKCHPERDLRGYIELKKDLN